jgi:hypothetical protein
MQVQTDLRAGGRGHRCSKCGYTSYSFFSYNDVLSHIRIDHNFSNNDVTIIVVT